MEHATRYPNALKTELTESYVGKLVHEADTPNAIIDVAAVRRNCQSMLDACETLGVKFRAHVKTHKVSIVRTTCEEKLLTLCQTVELTQLQVGEGSRPVNIAVSTIAELELLLPLLSFCASQSRPVNVSISISFYVSQAMLN